MSNDNHIYKFKEFEYNEEEEKLSDQNGEIALTGTEKDIFLFLLRHKEKVFTRAQIIEEIRDMDTFIEESNIDVHISSLRVKLRDKSKKIIKTVHKKGYKFAAPLITDKKNKEPEKITEIPSEKVVKDGVTDPLSKLPSPVITESAIAELPKPNLNELFETRSDKDHHQAAANHSSLDNRFNSFQLFIVNTAGLCVAALLFFLGYYLKVCFYGCLEQNTFIAFQVAVFAILTVTCLFLECAYEFDKYGWQAVKILSSVFLTAAGTIFAAYSTAEFQLPDHPGYALVSASVVILFGSGANCILAFFVLPQIPITAVKATIQAQPAFTAFLKNIFLYCFPLYMIFGVTVFCLIYSNSSASVNAAYPIGLFIGLLIFFVVSHFSTNVLLQNLRTSAEGEEFRYYGFFSSLLIFRQLLFFGVPFINLIYYFFIVLR